MDVPGASIVMVIYKTVQTAVSCSSAARKRGPLSAVQVRVCQVFQVNYYVWSGARANISLKL